MDGVRGKDKLPGAFRTEQNWIGSKGCTIDQARFIPPNPMVLSEHLEKWERYVQQGSGGALIKLSIIHAQFEILHPFMDGNGRMGRIVIPLYLYQRKILHRPMFYLSEFLETHRDAYYDKLLLITDSNDWQGWIEFFMTALIQQANANTEKARKIKQLYDRLKDAFREATHSQYATAALDTFFAKPIITASDFFGRSHIPTYATANTILRTLHKAGYISQLKEGAGRSPAVYNLPELLNIAEGRTVFAVNTAVMS
jgi:Fic family protein